MKIPSRFVIASNNQAKTQELIKCFQWLGQEAISYQQLLGKLNFPDEGTTSYVDNATGKAQFVANQLPGEWVVGDDSGMILQAYPNQLGVVTARQLNGRYKTDDDLNNLIIDLVANKTRKVQMRSYLVAIHGRTKVFAEGEFNGHISEVPTGDNGGGFDKILEPDGYVKTLAELSDSEKMPLLHRTKAIENLLQQLRSQNDAN
ncbi:non-canonical purine NTP pyrophosphatase [Lentilactobacillus sp. SPB1-3]|uniref:Non-canonical purine NTP pyrophosphatase n=1 Tax=Lentilactobacillus terminaliae TaxID=3003483 RepID=A0ACD5DCS4_9LACO|nr:non-canonical purine NTP pyrophosphatase [Lentilactobacillus sp. SPB1-3]MCZ0977981.1 non-canonical purine NTP pyrophosphatase [Lentilactobacillus sp. SPB1-3]